MGYDMRQCLAKQRIKEYCQKKIIDCIQKDYLSLQVHHHTFLLSKNCALLLPVVLFSALLTGCITNNSQDKGSQKDNHGIQSPQKHHSLVNTTTALQPPILVNTVQPPQLQKGDKQKENSDAKQVKEGLRNSYARLAAKRADVCPKLLQTSVDNNVIEHILVKSNNDQIESLLVVPTLHNFANGRFLVKSSQKHVIRLKYNGANYKADSLRYDVSVILD